jgi:hypothetical protein
MTEEEERIDKLNAAQEMIDWLTEHTEVPLPYGFGGQIFLTEEEARAARKGTFGWKKIDAGQYIEYLRLFGDDGSVGYTIYVDKSDTSTCRRVQVGVRHVEAREDPIYKWICDGDPAPPSPMLTADDV